MSLGTYNMRMWMYDTRSEDTSNEIYHTFDVVFTYECQDDYFTLSGVSEQSFVIGSSDATISLGMSQAISNCYKTVEPYYWNNSTSAWTAITSAPFYKVPSDATNQIKIGASARSSLSFASDESEQYYEIKVVWTSPYSTRSDAIAEEQFTIRFYDACMDNALSISSQLADATFQVHASNTATYTPSISQSVSGCSLTATCEIYDTSKDAWVGCQSGGYADTSTFFYSFNSVSGAYVVQYTVSAYTSYYSAPYSDHDYDVRITLEDPYSFAETKSVSDTFTLTISYVCALDALTLGTDLAA